MIFVSTAQQLRRHRSGSPVDVVHLFETILPSAVAQTSGLRVPAAHEDFPCQGGWSSNRKQHRQRFRHVMRHRRPEVLLVSLPQAASDRGALVLVRHRVDVVFAREAVKAQIKDDKHFYLEASPDDDVWTSDEWISLMDGSEQHSRRQPRGSDAPPT